MALEPAGVDLQAKGFQDYIRKLQAIEKAQKKAFEDSELKKLGLTYNQAVNEAKKYENQIKKTTGGVNSLNAAFGQLAIGVFSQQTAQAVIEAARMAAAFQGQTQALTNLAASYGQSGDEIRQAITRAADGVLSQTKIIDVALQGTQLQVAKTPEEFERLTAALIRIGQARGVGGQAAVERGFLGIGKRETELLDELGITTRQINGEMEKLAQRDFGKTAAGLSTAQRELLFVEAAITVAEQAAERFGDSTVEAVKGFERVAAEAENLELVLGTALLPTTSEFGNLLADALITAQQLTALVAGGAAGIGSILQDISPAANVGDLFGQFQGGEITLAEFLFGTGEPLEDKSLDQILRDAGNAGNEAFKNVARAQGIAFPEDMADEATQSIEENTEALKNNEAQIKTLQSAIRQAEQLQLSFTRAQEDAARKLERSQAKLADKQFKEQNKLAEKQVKEREDLLQDQIDDLADFEDDRIKQIQNAEKDIAKVRESAGKDRVKQQRDIQRELRQAQERFNLNQIQSQRRFELSDKRLRAEGDILALQQLREDHDLQQQEDKENFDLAQRQNKENTNEQLKELEEQTKQQEQELQERLAELKVNLEEERGVLLQGFDNQLAELEISQAEQKQALVEAQAEQRQALLDSYAEQQEDARINKQRQLEDLGRALADERDLTAEGAMAIASELEAVFGEEGVADTIFGGFTTRTESEFRTLFDSIEGIVKDAVESPTAPVFLPIIQKRGSGRNTLGGLGASSGAPASFDDGGVIPGPIGVPQTIRAHGGETVLPTHKMSLPASLSQALNVNVSGGIDINGAEGASSGVVDAAVEQVLDNFEIAITRMVRRHS